MSKTLTAADRSSLIRLASSLPAGSAERRVILAGLQKTARLDDELEALVERVTGVESGHVLAERVFQVRLSNGSEVGVELALTWDEYGDTLHFHIFWRSPDFMGEEWKLHEWTPKGSPTEKEIKKEVATAKAKFKAFKWPKSWDGDLEERVYSAVVSYEGTVLEVETFTDEFYAEKAAKGMGQNVRIQTVQGAPQWNKIL